MMMLRLQITRSWFARSGTPLSMVEKSTPTLRVKPKLAHAVSPEQEALELADEQLLKSIEAGDVAAVEGSDRSGADVNIADESQDTAVHKAARCDDLRVIKFLLSRGAHPAFLDNEGNQPAAVAIKFNNAGALHELLKVTGEDGQRVVDPLHVNPKTGNTLMHEAAWFGRDDCLKILLNTGAFTKDVLDQRNDKGRRPPAHLPPPCCPSPSLALPPAPSAVQGWRPCMSPRFVPPSRSCRSSSRQAPMPR